MVHEDDLELARRVIQGDEAAFNTFFDRYYARAYRFCQRRVPDADAEDVAMETIRHAVNRLETYRGEAALITWLYQVARSQLSAHFKRERKHRHLVLIDDNEQVRAEVDAMAAELHDGPEALNDAAQHRHLVHMMLDYLPGDYGQVLEWKYIDGFSVDEIAEKLEATPTAIQSMLARARRAFRESYGKIRAHLGETRPAVEPQS